MIYRLAMGAKGAQIVNFLPGHDATQPKHMFVTKERYLNEDQARAALFSLKIRCGAKLSQNELYAISALLEGLADNERA